MKSFALILLLLINTHSALADTEKYPNVGLINITDEYKKSFPICEKQLIVNWIDTEKRNGYTEFDAYAKEKHVDTFKSFVDLNPPSLSYKRVAYYPKNQNDGKQYLISNRKKQNPNFPYFVNKQRLVSDSFEELVELVKNHGLKYYSSDLYTQEESQTIQQIVNGIRSLSLTNHSSNVCVIYPDKKHAWLAELKQIRYTHTQEQIDRLYEKLKHLFMHDLYKANPNAHRKVFETFSSFDLNGDGNEDYFNWFSAIYSMQSGNLLDYGFKQFFINCETIKHGTDGSQITTDGNTFNSKGCNLNEFLSM